MRLFFVIFVSWCLCVVFSISTRAQEKPDAAKGGAGFQAGQAAQAGMPAPPLDISEVERLKYENLVTRLQLVRLQKDALAEQYRKLLEEEGRLQQEIPTLLREILKAHGHPDGSIDWEKRRVVPKPPGGGAGIPAGPAAQAGKPVPPPEQKKPEEKKQ